MYCHLQYSILELIKIFFLILSLLKSKYYAAQHKHTQTIFYATNHNNNNSTLFYIYRFVIITLIPDFFRLCCCFVYLLLFKNMCSAHSSAVRIASYYKRCTKKPTKNQTIVNFIKKT